MGNEQTGAEDAHAVAERIVFGCGFTEATAPDGLINSISQEITRLRSRIMETAAKDFAETAARLRQRADATVRDWTDPGIFTEDDRRADFAVARNDRDAATFYDKAAERLRVLGNAMPLLPDDLAEAAEAAALTAKRDGMIEAAGIADREERSCRTVLETAKGDLPRANWAGAANTARIIAKDIRTRAASLTGEGAGFVEMHGYSRDPVKLRRLLEGRDQFIVDRGLWNDFVDTLPADAPHTETRGER